MECTRYNLLIKSDNADVNCPVDVVGKVLVWSVHELLEDQKSQNHEEAENRRQTIRIISSRGFGTSVNYRVFALVIIIALLKQINKMI